MTLPEMVAALERARGHLSKQISADARLLKERAENYNALLNLASLLNGAQEAWQFVSTDQVSVSPHDEVRNTMWRRVYIVPAEEEK